MMLFLGANPKVVLRGKGLKSAELDKPATFSIDGRQAGNGKNYMCLFIFCYVCIFLYFLILLPYGMIMWCRYNH